MAKPRAALTGTTCPSKSGLEALSKGNRNKVNLDGLEIIESVDIDSCFSESEPNANRWDYFIDIRRRGEMYLEVHELSEEHLSRILRKADWLRNKIATHDWPSTHGRPLFIAPTKGISPSSIYGLLSKKLALHKITPVMKGDRIADLLS